jgi:hypothetical protein
MKAWLESIRALLQQMMEPQQMQPVRIKVEEQPQRRQPVRRRR